MADHAELRDQRRSERSQGADQPAPELADPGAADRRALHAAGRLGLDEDAGGLAERVSRRDYPRLLATLVRSSLAKDFDELLEAAGHQGRERRLERRAI